MDLEKGTETIRTCRACTEKCIASSHRPFEWDGPSFFKVMKPNSFSRLDIPTDFVKRMQLGVCKDAILQGPSGHLWHVNLCCADSLASFTDGWESFVSDQLIDAEDILVFTHFHDVHFAVQIFGASGCEKGSSFSLQNYTSCCFRETELNLSKICNKKRCEHRQNSTTTSVSLLTGMNSNRNGNIEVKYLKREQDETALDSSKELMNSSEINATDIMMVPMEGYYICENDAELYEENHPPVGACTDVTSVGEEEEDNSLPHLTLKGIKSAKPKSSRKFPEFSLVLQKTAVNGQYRIPALTRPPFYAPSILQRSLYPHRSSPIFSQRTVPHEFAGRWMSKIKGKKYKVILLFENKPKQWNVTFITYERNAGFFCGWRAFAVANGLQKGDKCVFRLVDKVKYIFKVHVIGHELHEDRGGRRKEINITSAHALVPHEKMKTSVVKIDPYRLVESIIPQCMAEYNKGSRMRGSMVGYESHNPFEITYIQGPTENTQIEVIEID